MREPSAKHSVHVRTDGYHLKASKHHPSVVNKGTTSQFVHLGKIMNTKFVISMVSSSFLIHVNFFHPYSSLWLIIVSLVL